jgi:hypothetical protein
MLGNIEKLPEVEEQLQYEKREDVKNFFSVLAEDPENLTNAVHLAAHKLLSDGAINEAWMLLVANQKNN